MFAVCKFLEGRPVTYKTIQFNSIQFILFYIAKNRKSLICIRPWGERQRRDPSPGYQITRDHKTADFKGPLVLSTSVLSEFNIRKLLVIQDIPEV